MKPEMHYAESDCPVSAPGNFPKDDEFRFEIALVDFPKAKADLITNQDNSALVSQKDSENLHFICFDLSFVVSFVLMSRLQMMIWGSSRRWFGIQLNPPFMSIDLK
ncbi:unnamed protein product [Arabidopsis halleri]